MCSLIISLLCVITVAPDIGKVNCDHTHHMKVCLKEKLKDFVKSSISTETTNFKDFVIRSDLFVDKSLLIKSILEEKSLVSLTYPMKWGKTLNLDMLKNFLDIEFDHKGSPVPACDTWSYNFFKKGIIIDEDGRGEKLVQEPMISKHDDIIDKYLARYPVINIDLSRYTFVVNNFDDFFNEFLGIIAEAFKKYSFILDIIRDKIDSSAVDESEITKYKNQLKKIKAFKRRDVHDYEEVMKSLQFLSSLLHQYCHQRAVVLIDNYDAPIQLGYFKKLEQVGPKEAHKFMDFFIDFMTATFIGNEYIAKGVLTGILSLDLCSTPLLGLDYIVNYNALSRNTYPFYGFSAIEVGQLLSLAVDSEGINKVLDYYNGYHTLNYPDITIYHPGSIANALKERKICENWFLSICSQGPQILPQVLSYKNVRNLFKALITHDVDAKILRRNFTLQRDDIILLHKMITNASDSSLSAGDVALVSMFHFAIGYLTLNFTSMLTNWNKEIPVKIPFVDVEKVIKKEMVIG